MKSLRRGQVGSVSGLDTTFESSCLVGPVAPGRELADFTASFSLQGYCCISGSGSLALISPYFPAGP